MTGQLLEGVKVLDGGYDIAGPYCTKLLADFGAEVIKVEPPDGGDPSRKAGPFPKDEPNPEASGLFIFLNNNKKGITLNFKTDTGVKIFKELVKWADILVEDFSPSHMPSLGLAYKDLEAVNPGLVMTSITPFGQTGPYRDYRAPDIVVQALSGWLDSRGEPDREPLRGGGPLRLTEFNGGALGSAATMTALTYRNKTGIGQHVDVSEAEAASMLQNYPYASTRYPHALILQKRQNIFPGVEECKDGYVGMTVITGEQWVNFCHCVGMDELAENPAYISSMTRVLHNAELRERMRPWLEARTAQEIFDELLLWRVPPAMAYTNKTMLDSPQHKARKYFIEVEHPVAGKLTQPGPWCRSSEPAWQLKSPAPLLGQHNTEVYGRLGYSNNDLVFLKQTGVI
jgi:CoA:oxalate CoA-transferase